MRLLAVHPVTGIHAEALVDMLWENPPNGVARPLRKERYNLRAELRRLVSELAADPLPASQIHGEKVVSLDVSVVASDVHEFTELLRCADGLVGAAAIDALEAAGSLYRGDLLDRPDVPTYRWLYDEDLQVALTLRSDFRRLPEMPVCGSRSCWQTAPRRAWRELRSCTRRCARRTPRRTRLWIALFRIHARHREPPRAGECVATLSSAMIEFG